MIYLALAGSRNVASRKKTKSGLELSVFSVGDAKRKHYIGSFGKTLFGVSECILSCSYLGLKGVSWNFCFAKVVDLEVKRLKMAGLQQLQSSLIQGKSHVGEM